MFVKFIIGTICLIVFVAACGFLGYISDTLYRKEKDETQKKYYDGFKTAFGLGVIVGCFAYCAFCVWLVFWS